MRESMFSQRPELSEEDQRLAWDRRVEEITRPPCVIGAGAMLAAASLQTLFLAKGAVPAGAITLITGMPGAKKSWLAYDLALATAQEGRSWLGFPVTPRGPTRNVLVLNYDNPTPECGRRFMRLGMQESDPIHFHSVDLDPLRLPELAAELRAMVTHFRPSLVLVDSLRQAHTGDENSSEEMMAVMGHLKSFYSAGAAVVVVHHEGKGGIAAGVSKARGSGEIAASADAHISVSCSDAIDIATWEKHRSWRMSATEESLPFELIDRGDLTILKLKE